MCSDYQYADKEEEKLCMDALNVLLVCGGGASSGFMAVNLRKAAAARRINLDAKARSETEVELYVGEVNAILLGPHLSYLEKELKERINNPDIKVLVIDRAQYSTLDGEGLLSELLSHFE